jgi:hypothetical protein
MDDPESSTARHASWWSRYGFKATIGAASLVAGFFLARALNDVPPGPRPDRLELKQPGTVIIRVQPDHRNKMQGAVFEQEPKHPGQSVVSHIVISGPVKGDPIPGFPFVLALDKVRHLDPMTAQIALEDPQLVDLEYPFDVPGPDNLYSLLYAAREANPGVEFNVSIYCWYRLRDKYDESFNEGDLEVH